MAKSPKKRPDPKQPASKKLLISPPPAPKPSLFPIAGIGASAGGLEALEQFLSNVPENSGMAYVVIQHLDPTQKGMLPELLQRISKVKVFQVKDGMVVKPNCVYVIPPNKSMSILKGILYLFEPLEARGMRLPIDFFMRSLADDRQDLSIGIVLSGMGSDGSSGLRAIKEHNGIVLVQEPETAKFDSMPRNAIDSVLVDIVAPANELPQKLLELLKHLPLVKIYPEVEIKDKSALEKIIILLRSFTGNDFSLYKKSTLYRRIERRMGAYKIDKISSYVSLLQENPKEVDILFKELLIGVTNFFRDTKVWEKFGRSVLPEMILSQPSGHNLRAWVAGCSSGEEAYSLAIIFKEAMENIKPRRNISLQIFATDLDQDSIEVARRGIYPENIAADVSPERLNRFFVKTDEGYRVNTEIREMVIFAQHNIIMHPPFTKIDILSCRNLLIYLDGELQTKILKLFFYSMNSEAIMLLGSSESLGTINHLFKPVDSGLKIYRRSADALLPDVFNFPSSYARSKPEHLEKQPTAIPGPSIQELADQMLLQHFSPPGLLVNEEGDIIYITGRTGKYLEPASGKANMNVFAMLREGLRNDFPAAFYQAIIKKGKVVLRNLQVGINGGTHKLNITIQWIDKPEPLKNMVLIVFSDITEVHDIIKKGKRGKEPLNSSRETELEKELQSTQEKMQSTVEEMQASQEELKSTNEELQSANEELQSTNEELTSSKEEMQSLNEELQTVNAELQAKVDDFSRLDNDMKNLLNSTDIATLFLDKELNIRRYTIQATKIFKLIKSDIGRPITDQVSDINYPELAEDALEVLNTLIFIEKQIPGKDGQWFSVRIMPYRTFEDRIDGLVITFINISELKKVEEECSQTKLTKRLLLNSYADPVVLVSAGLTITDLNPMAEKFFGIKPEDAISQNWVKFCVAEPERKKTEDLLQKMLTRLEGGASQVQVKKAGGKKALVECEFKIVLNNQKNATGIMIFIKR
jgi:two-component system, chemotaxis family, CheB/CheR fusion protein